MVESDLGPQAFTEEDGAYAGARFAEVRDAVFAEPYQKVWGDEGKLPVHQVTLASVVSGIAPFGRPFAFFDAAKRIVDSNADLRWGPDGKGYRRLLHPNGVCMTGEWEITEATSYSGYFEKGRRGLVLARYSTCCTETRRGRYRSLSLVGKLYPTTDPEHPEPLGPATFISQQDLGGARTDYINDAELRNAPDTTAWRRGLGLPILLLTGVVFLRADREPAIRQLYEIAELGKDRCADTVTPEFMRLQVAAEQPSIEGAGLDFRDEVMAQIYDPGDPKPKRRLVFGIEVANEGRTCGPGFFQRRKIHDWRRIGRMSFDAAVASHNGDCVVHFHHPTWRRNRNDPDTATRVGRRKVKAPPT